MLADISNLRNILLFHELILFSAGNLQQVLTSGQGWAIRADVVDGGVKENDAAADGAGNDVRLDLTRATALAARGPRPSSAGQLEVTWHGVSALLLGGKAARFDSVVVGGRSERQCHATTTHGTSRQMVY